LEHFFSGFATILHPMYLAYMFGGVAMGLVLGFMPGLTAATGIALMLPFTFTMEPLTALVFLLSIYTGGLFGGAVTAVMLNTPGAPSNIMTTLDGYPMNRRGESERALGLALMSSVLGGLIGCVCLLLVAEPMARFALDFGPGEMFMVAIFGISVVGSLSNDVFKALFSGLFGILIGTIGMNTNGVMRGTMGVVWLLDGIPLVPALIGLVALPAIFEMATAKNNTIVDLSQERPFIKLVKGCLAVFKHPIQAVLCSVLGVVVGIMPAAGGSVAGVLAYNQSKQWMKNGDKFGTGVDEGIISCETANNASEGGALATMFVLGIPGSTATAMMLGALIIQGWNPGPKLFIDHSEIIYAAFSSLFCQQIVMLILGSVLCLFAAKLMKLPTQYLMPCVVVFTILGAFSSRYSVFDAGLMLAFGFIGWFMKRQGYPAMPLILGLLLGEIADNELLRVFQAFDSFWEIFKSPITLVLALISIISVALPPIMKSVRVKKKIE